MKCYDCGKKVWFWQNKGIDGQSHRSCHRKRIIELMRTMPDMRNEIMKEVYRTLIPSLMRKQPKG